MQRQRIGLWTSRLLTLACPGVVLGMLGCAGDDGRAEPLSRGSLCASNICSPEDGGGGGTQDSGLEDAKPEDYTGPRGSAEGTVFAMIPPDFSPYMSPQTESLAKPAKVSVYAYGVQYSTEYTKADGFLFEGVPIGLFDVLVEDIENGNGILPSMIRANVSTETNWPIPVTTRNSMSAIFASQKPPLVLDEKRAHIVVSFVSCDLKGASPQSGVVVNASATSGGVLYQGPNGWELNAAGGTGSNGVAIIANIEVDDYPGVLTRVNFATGGASSKTDEFRITAGAVSRVFFFLPC